MKKRALQMLAVGILILSMIALLSGCYSKRMREYYSQRENYVNATGTVIHIICDEDDNALYLAFSDLSPKFSDNNFEIVGDNFSIVRGNGIDEKIHLGDQVEFVSAPAIFGDGYIMPIVAISVNGECLLDFEEGFVNLNIRFLEKRSPAAKSLLTLATSRGSRRGGF